MNLTYITVQYKILTIKVCMKVEVKILFENFSQYSKLLCIYYKRSPNNTIVKS